jgi:hypothetical protein
MVFNSPFFLRTSFHTLYDFFSQPMVQIRHPLSHLCKPFTPSHRLETGWKGFTCWFHASSFDVPMASHRCSDGALRVFVHIAG